MNVPVHWGVEVPPHSELASTSFKSFDSINLKRRICMKVKVVKKGQKSTKTQLTGCMAYFF